jgi:hypothetical protein
VRKIADSYTTMSFSAKQSVLMICIAVKELLMRRNAAKLALPSANSHTHHFNSYFSPQDGVTNGHQPNKNHTFYVFDTECI